MRPIMLLAPIALLVSACAKSDTPAADTGAAMAMAPAMMMEADVAGSWTGTSMPEGSDSVVARWTQMCGGGTCKGTVEGMPDTVVSTYTISGDSAVGVSTAYMEPTLKLRVVDTWVARAKDGTVGGTQVTKLADKDSVLMRTRFTGTRATK